MVRRRAAAAVVLATLLTGCSGPGADPEPTVSGGDPPPTIQAPPVKGTVRTNAITLLSLRAEPTTQSKRLARIKNKTVITLRCKTIGATVSNGSRASNVWNKIVWRKRTGYVSSVFVDGGDSAALSVCQETTPTPSTTPTRPPNVEQLIVAEARNQLGVGERKGKKDCTPYGACMPWDALFATWVWNKAGNTVPPFSFSGDLYTWGQKHERSHAGVEGVGIGDMVLTGTGPQHPKSSKRVDIVTEVLPDGSLRVIGGDVKNKVAERIIPANGIYGWVEA